MLPQPFAALPGALAALLLGTVALGACGATADKGTAPPPSGELADPDPADPAGPADPADPAEGANFATPPVTDPGPLPGAKSSGDPALDARIRETLGASCGFARACGDLLGVDCNAAADGPYYYVRRDTLEILGRCGGHCMTGDCTACPPKEWTCGPDYFEE